MSLLLFAIYGSPNFVNPGSLRAYSFFSIGIGTLFPVESSITRFQPEKNRFPKF
ncbi:hypothetical protein LEP1GSC016_4174 [Leptospira borgpetersenii serovar Hardjo-bovis str. Sponselee]|uniref:Uncharacterized protein n=1 Tax=Leptospira borgpetersenii serovar Hardjo-bovis str. Sponselee TaxID=1303729 RepID=M6C8F0_LEPBO|nr:hypothetical protein LEP1GSC016_4174 [Leptospira borgpetersenii serovar Hardjo-bovis str. Sponselee]